MRVLHETKVLTNRKSSLDLAFPSSGAVAEQAALTVSDASAMVRAEGGEHGLNQRRSHRLNLAESKFSPPCRFSLRTVMTVQEFALDFFSIFIPFLLSTLLWSCALEDLHFTLA